MEQNGTIIMTVRRIASYLGATAGALALALAPSIANAAGPFNHIEIGGVAVTSTGTTFTGTGVAPINATIPGFGTITCSSATAGGTVLPTTAKVTSLSLACPSIIPGTTVTIGVNTSSTKCPNGIVLTPTAGQTVDKMASAVPNYAGPYDLVTGSANFGSGATDNDKCVAVQFKIGSLVACSFKLYGTVPWTFNETPLATTPVSQRLNIAGNLTISSLSGACPGLSNGVQIALSVPLNITTASAPGVIDFVP